MTITMETPRTTRKERITAKVYKPSDYHDYTKRKQIPDSQIDKIKFRTMRSLKTLRDYYGLSLVDFSERIGVSKSTVWNAEKGLYMPKFKTLLRICRIYGITLEDLTGESF